MGVLVKCVIFSLFVKSHLFIKVFTTPKMDYDEALSAAFSRFINVSTPVLTNISSCLWVSLAFEDLGSVWITENRSKYFMIELLSKARYLWIGGMSVRFEFPEDFFIPDQWFFYCFAYNNENKKLEVYLNSEKIFDNKIEKHLDAFVIDKNFLQYEKFGMAGIFAGQFTDLNIWSRILKDSEIAKLFKCEVLDKGPDIVDWKSSQPVPGSKVIVSKERAHPCNENT